MRIELDNREALLKPSMYARVELASSRGKGRALAVPDSAVLDTGTRQLVLVQRGEGRYEPRPVKLGMRADGYVEVLEGVKAGENVVVSANFLIDAESNLKAAFSGFGQGGDSAGSDQRVSDRRGSDQKGEAKPAAPAVGAVAVTHRGEGMVDAVDTTQTSVTLTHGLIASLKWPAMTMDFKVRDAALLRTLKPGQMIAFEMVAGAPGEYVIVRAQPSATTPSAADAHKGH